MNNQYEYAEKSLTPRIAQHLIIELFTGRTVQKQEIMRIVDETHRERGGLSPRAKFKNPVTLALYNMTREGLVENPSQGYCLILSTTQEDDSMDPEPGNLEPEKIIGSGKQSVYLYYYPAYQRLANCKVKKDGHARSARLKTTLSSELVRKRAQHSQNTPLSASLLKQMNSR